MTDRRAALARLPVPAIALAACACVEPQHPSGWILCPFRLLTGLPCPMCGMTRGIASLLRGRWPDAVAYHAFSPLVAAGLAAWILVELGQAAGLWNAHKLHDNALRPAPWLAFLAVCVVYGALRWCGIIEVPRN